MVGAWVCIHAFVFAVNQWPGSRALLKPFEALFEAAFAVGFSLAPLWLVAALVLTVFLALRKQVPARVDRVVSALLVGLIGLYFLVAFLSPD